jgi:predicted nucleic acid-binding protein
MTIPTRVFLDTNVYIVGSANSTSSEWKILQWLGFESRRSDAAEVVISAEVIEQILRVAKRLKNKDWAGSVVARIWQNLKLRYVLINEPGFQQTGPFQWLPREDIVVYLTAKFGKADCFISSNHELIRVIAAKTGEFECLKPEDFVRRYLEK